MRSLFATGRDPSFSGSWYSSSKYSVIRENSERERLLVLRQVTVLVDEVDHELVKDARHHLVSISTDGSEFLLGQSWYSKVH